jgi:hypothetical protein
VIERTMNFELIFFIYTIFCIVVCYFIALPKTKKLRKEGKSASGYISDITFFVGLPLMAIPVFFWDTETPLENRVNGYLYMFFGLLALRALRYGSDKLREREERDIAQREEQEAKAREAESSE